MNNKRNVKKYTIYFITKIFRKKLQINKYYHLNIKKSCVNNIYMISFILVENDKGEKTYDKTCKRRLYKTNS